MVLFCVKRFCREEFDKNNNLTKHFYEFIFSHCNHTVYICKVSILVIITQITIENLYVHVQQVMHF